LGDRGVRRVDHELPFWSIDAAGARIALVAHAGTNSVFMCHLLGLQPTPWEWDRFVLGHASISRLEAIPVGDGYTFSLTSLSNREHLPPADRTR
jgi:probable phosphoglycerate mutase